MAYILPDDEKYDIIAEYTRYYDEAVNHGLRTGVLSKRCNRIVESIIETLNMAPPTEEIVTLYRGIKETSKFNVSSLKVGDLIKEKGFASKSSHLNVAADFAGEGCCILVVEYPPGSKLIGLDNVSQFPMEKEVLTYPGEVFEIIEHLDGYIYAKVVWHEVNYVVDKSLDDNYETIRECILSHNNVYFVGSDIFITTGKEKLGYSIMELLESLGHTPYDDVDEPGEFTYLNHKDIGKSKFEDKLYVSYITGKLVNGFYGPPWIALRC